MTILKGIAILLCVLPAFSGLCTAFLTLPAIFRKKTVFPETEKRCRYAILIAARNEEKVIGDLLESLKRQDYPQELMDVCVIIDRCSDGTEKIALSHGASIIHGNETLRSKADALRLAFYQLKDSDFDAYVIFDADNIADRHFLSEINKVFASGAHLIQGKRCGIPSQDSWVASSYRIYYAIQNAAFNTPRMKIGLSAAFNGSGWAVTKELIDQHGFACRSITEDFEYTLLNVLQDQKIVYCEKAVSMDEFPEDLKTSLFQRIRWSYGMVECLRHYQKDLFRKALKGSLICLDFYFVNMTAPIILSCLAAALAAYVWFYETLPFLLYLPVIAAILWIALSLVCLYAVIADRDGLPGNIKGVMLFPWFILTWVPVMISCFFRKDYEWVPLAHYHSVSGNGR